MRRSMLTLALVSLCGLAVASVVGQKSGALQPFGNAAPQARSDRDRVMDEAVRAAVAAGVSRQFGDSRVEVQLDRLDVRPASIRDRDVAGHGRIRLGQDRAWVPFRFEALYDTESAAVSAPRLALGDSHPGREVEPDSDIAQALAARVGRELSDEFAQQAFDLRIDRVVTQKTGDRLVQVRGKGVVDFGSDGSTATEIEALYDRVDARWLHVSYELGPSVAPGDALQGPALAASF